VKININLSLKMRTRQTPRKNRNSCITRTQRRLEVTTSDTLFIATCILVFGTVMAVFAFMGGYIYMEAKWNEESTYKLKEEIIQLERSLQLEQEKMKPRTEESGPSERTGFKQSYQDT